jgi:hypothetical protein
MLRDNVFCYRIWNMNVNDKHYWNLKARWKELVFILQKRIYETTEFLDKQKQEAHIFRELFGLVRLPVVQSFGLAFLCLILDMSGVILFREFLNNSAFFSIHSLDLNSFNYLLSTATQVAGIFMTLYFTSVGLVISSSHLKSQRKPRDLFLKDSVSQSYIQIILLFISVSLLFLFINSLHISFTPNVIWSDLPKTPYTIKLSYISLVFYVLFSLFTTYTFFHLGNRLFSFYNFERLTSLVHNDILKELRSVTKGQLFWKDPNFQNHSRRKVEELLTFFDECFNKKTIENKKYSDEEVIKGEKQLLQALIDYSQYKPLLPSDSYWYQRSVKHQRLNKMDSHAKIRMLQTNVIPAPETGVDRNWFEQALKKNHTHYLALAPSQEAIANMFSMVCDSVETIASHFNMVSCEFLYDQLIDYYNNKTVLTDSVYSIRLVDSIGTLPIVHLLGTTRYLKRKTFLTYLETIEFDNIESIYSVQGCSSLLQLMEKHMNEIVLEKEIEGRFVTPKWYFDQQIIVEFNDYLAKDLKSILKYAQKIYIDHSKLLAEKEQSLEFFHLLLQGFEFLEKYLYHKESIIMPALNQLKGFEKLTEFPIAFDYLTELDNHINEMESNLFDLLIQYLEQSIKSESENNESIPDYFRLVIYHALDKSLNRMAQGNFSNFNTVYEKLLRLTFIRFELERREGLKSTQNIAFPQAWLTHTYNSYYTFMVYSAMAIVYGELFNQPVVATIQATWGTSSLNLTGFRELATIPDIPMVTDPDYYIHFEWEKQLSTVLTTHGFTQDAFVSSCFGGSAQETKKNKNKILSVLMSKSSMKIIDIDSLYNLFLVLILEDENFRFPKQLRRDDIREALKND